MDNADVLGNVTTAIMTYFNTQTGGVNNAFWLAVNGRLFEGEAPEGTEFPYSVYSVVSSPKEKLFAEEYRRTLIQFDFYSTNSSSGEVKDIYAHASTLFDECTFSITGSTMIWIHETNFMLNREEGITPSGTQMVWHGIADFEAITLVT